MREDAHSNEDERTDNCDPRLDKDVFYLYPWATATHNRHRGRKYSDRATVDDNPSTLPGESATLDAYAGEDA